MIVLYFSTVSSNMEIKKQQQKIEMVLQGKKIEYTIVDIAASEDDKNKMREVAGDPTVLPPQICNDEKYCGGYDAFDDAVEAEDLDTFLKL